MCYDDDDVDEMFERAKRAYRRESEREQNRIRRDAEHAEDWTQSVIGWLLQIVQVFATVWHSCCYITTAVTHHFGLPDDCRYLNVLRGYRDRYIVRSGITARIQDLRHYYEIAPAIVRAIKRDPHSELYWRSIAYTVQDAVRAIDSGEDALAYELFKNDVLGLRDRLLDERHEN